MATRMLIDARHPEETRVAVVKGNRIEEFDFEAAARQQIKGNIYLAKVTRVEPSLQAAFVDYGGNRHGFLAFSEIHPDYYQIPKEDRDALLHEEQQLVEESAAHDLDDGYAAPADAAEPAGDGEAGDNGETPAPSPEEHGNNEEASAEALRRRRMALRRRYKIQEVIRRRQVMLVQVVKEERGNKGAALTTYISLAGRYSVLMPNTAHGGGISRKIANAADRKRLKAIMTDLDLPRSMGAIVRTAGLERTKTEIKRDFDYLTRLWDEIRDRTLHSSAPALIYEDSDLIKRAIRDIYSRDIDEVLVDGDEGYRQARNFMKLLMPSHARKVQAYVDSVPLFHRAGVESQLAALMNPVVQLRSGGYIVINPTEALVAIDVNSGRSTREYNIEETALKTNIEAAEEVARQLRLRDLAGLVVVDFIDMEVSSNNRKVERAMKEALKHDRARIQVGRISAFGLLEMSRQRLRTGVLEASTEVCPMCSGLGLIRTPGSAALAALRMLEDEAVKARASHFRLRTDETVSVYMLNRKRSELSELEDRYGVIIEIVPDESLVGGRLAIDSSGPPPARAPKALPALPHVHVYEEDEEEEEFPDIELEGEDSESPHEEEAHDEPREGGRRRRRRRGGRNRNGEAQRSEQPATAGTDVEVSDSDADAALDAAGETGAEAENGESGERRRRRRRRRRGHREERGDATALTAETHDDAEGPQTEAAAEADVAEANMVEESAPMEWVEAAPAPEPAAEERPKRRPRRKPAPNAATEAVAETAETAVEAAPEPVAAAPEAEAPPEKPKRKRRTKAEIAADEAAAAEAKAAAAAKPRPRPRRKKAEPVATTAETMAETPANPQPETGVEAAQPVAEPEAAEQAPPTDGSDAEASAQPRRGWWQRTFGS